MSLKERLKSGESVIGTFITLASPVFVEVCAIAGFDFVVIDMEHSSISVDQAEDLVRAAELRGTTPIVRVPENSAHDILRALDTGAVGVHVPNVDTPDDAVSAVSYAKYSPPGSRGLAAVRASGYGLLETLPSYARRANDETMVVAHIESQKSIDHLDALLEVKGIDVYYIGPVDLSNDLGIPGEISDPKVVQRVESAISDIVAAGKVAGTICNDLPTLLHYKELGMRYFACHALRLMVGGAQQFIGEARS